MVDGSAVGPAMLATTQSLALFQGFLPKFQEIRKTPYGSNPGFETDVRMGEVAATLLTIGIGVVASGLTGSSVPTVVSIICSLGLIALYETALHANAVGAVHA